MNKLCVFLLLCCFASFGARADDLYPVATVGYVSGVASQYGCSLKNNADPSQIVNMQYLLQTIDLCNMRLTSYGSGTYATRHWANTNAVNKAMNDLIIQIGTLPEYVRDGLVVYYDYQLNMKTDVLVDHISGYNAQLYNTTGGNGTPVIFNGSSSYALIDAEFNPKNIGEENEITVEFVFKVTANVGSSNRLLYFSQTGWNGGFFYPSSSYNVKFLSTSVPSTTYDFGMSPASMVGYKMSLSVNHFKNDSTISATSVKMNNTLLETPAYNNYSAGSAVDNRFTIGRRNSGGYFPMELYAVRIYDRKLSAEEVLQNYQTDRVRFGL